MNLEPRSVQVAEALEVLEGRLVELGLVRVVRIGQAPAELRGRFGSILQAVVHSDGPLRQPALAAHMIFCGLGRLTRGHHAFIERLKPFGYLQ